MCGPLIEMGIPLGFQAVPQWLLCTWLSGSGRGAHGILPGRARHRASGLGATGCSRQTNQLASRKQIVLMVVAVSHLVVT